MAPSPPLPTSTPRRELPPDHPVRRMQRPSFRIALLLSTPFVLLALALWGTIGWLLTRPPRVVASIAFVAAWVLYVCIPHIPVRLLDWPLVLSLGVIVGALLPGDKKTWVAHTVPVAVLFVYSVVRVSVASTAAGTEKHIVNALAVLCCVVPAWIAVSNLRLWVPADAKELERLEKKVYDQYIVSEFSLLKVAGLGTVHVPYCGDSARLPPRNLVLVHGYMAGNGFWSANLQTLAKSFNVYAVEWKGIGRSDRPRFRPKNEQEMDDFFVESLEDWRRELQLDSFILCGHSMGAMYTTYYSEKYTQHIEHLILVSPAGVNSSGLKNEDLNFFFKYASQLYITPMSVIRFAGPLGLRLVQWAMRNRIEWTPPTNIIRSGELDFDLITGYSYHNWALGASGDIALYTHLHPGASARRRPLDGILVPGKIKVPLTIMYGGGPDWMNSEYGQAVIKRLESSHYAKFRLVPLSGHQVFMDNPADFNSVLIDAVHEEERSGFPQ